MDKILISGLSLPVLIGIHPEERQEKQLVCIDLEMTIDTSQAIATDKIEHAMDYELLANTLAVWLENSEFYLIESLADFIAKKILQTFPIAGVQVRLRKFPQCMAVESVGVLIQRERQIC